MIAPEEVSGGSWSITSAKFAWEIKKHHLVGKEFGDSINSPAFSALNAKWQLKLFPRGINQGGKIVISIALELLNCAKPVESEMKFVLTCPEGDIANGECKRQTFTTGSQIVKSLNFSYNYRSVDNIVENRKISKITFSCEFKPDANTSILEPLDFASALNDQSYSDVKFLAEGKPIYAHKIVLANKSRVFAAMFEHKMKESIDNVVVIEDVEYDVLLELFRYIYSGSVDGIAKIAKPLLMAADKYEVIDLKTDCGFHLGDKLTEHNVQEYLELAKRHDVYSLKEKVVDFIISNANEMIHTSRFTSITLSHPDVAVEVARCLS